jgi:hypothetical protein
MRERRALNPLVGLFAAALLSARAAGGADGGWISLGLAGKVVRSIAADPSSPATLYAACDGGTVFRSANSGGSWEAAANFGSQFLEFVAIDPLTPGTLYVGGDGRLFQKSSDGGRTWGSANFPAAAYELSAIAFDPVRGGALHVGGFDYGCDSPCLFRTANGGVSWTALDAAPPYLDVTALATSPARPGPMYVGTYGQGAFKIPEGGAIPQRISEGLADLFVYALAVDPHDSNVVYAGGGLTGTVSTSLDGGTSWRASTLGLSRTNAIVIDPRTSPSTVYAGGDAGVFRSRDLGGHWEAVNSGLAARVASLAISTAAPPVLYAGTWGDGAFALTLEIVPTADTGPYSWIVPSVTHAPGAGGAFYTTDLAIANPGAVDATLTIRFLGHDGEGTDGPVTTRMLAAGRAVTYADVLGSLFGIEIGYGALRVTSDAAVLRMTAFTSTRSADGRGSVGQGVPAFDATRLATPGSPVVLVGLRDDTSARTNLVLANASGFPVTVALTLVGPDGAVPGSVNRVLPPLGMIQVSSVVSALGGSAAGDAYLVLRVATAGGAVAAYASVTDNGTNDPRTILP